MKYSQKWLVSILFLLIVLVVTGTVGFFVYKQKNIVNTKAITSAVDFCAQKLQDTNSKLSKTNPNVFIKENKYSKELESWKKALLLKYQWDETFFSNHIRINKIEPYKSKEYDDVINPQYSFIIDWASFDIGGDIVTVGNGEVKKLVVNSFPAVEHIIPCDEAINKLKEYHSSLYPEYVSLNENGFTLEGYSGGYSGALKGCHVAEVSLINGEIINGRIDGPCRIY